jgi:NDP-sugar pyrophosphorylase family protein
MKAVIIAGGFGTRLQPLTFRRPKHLLPLANRPFLEYQVALLRKYGITEIVFATNYMAEQIEGHFGDGSSFGVSLRYALEDVPLGTAGAIRNASGKSLDSAIIVLNGDILTDFSLFEIVNFHKAREAQVTIALKPVDRPHGFGVIVTGEDGRVLTWYEPTEDQKKTAAQNPGPATGETDLINAGIYVLEPDVVLSIPEGRTVSIEREIFPQLLASGSPVFGIETPGYWIDIGRPEQYLAANAAVLSSQVRTDVTFDRIDSSAHVAADAEIDRETSIGPGCSIGPGSRLSRCIILCNVSVGSNSNLVGLIADDDTVVEDDTRSSATSVIASGSRITRGSRL